MALKLLEPALRSRLRSGVAITSVSQCVEELVENGIDAGATCIAVRVDITKFKVQVVDNGKGISFDDLCLIGERYMTSKCHTIEDVDKKLNYFGYRGEAIASIVDVSGTVEICSRHRLSQNTFSKIFHNGKAMPVTVSKSHRPSVGTTASVHDFFYNLPVRRRGISAALELEQVKRVVESVALMNPSVSFSVRNDATGECVLQTHKTNSVMNRFGLLFGRDRTTAMKDVSLSQAGFELSGFMSTEGHHNKSLQFIYVNGRIIKKTPLHTCVNNVLANSLLTRKLSRVAESYCTRKDQESVELLSPRRTPDVFGMYVLHIKCPRSEYDICLEPAKTLIEFKDWDRIMSAIEELVRDFLLKNNLTLAPINPATCILSPDQQEDRQGYSSPVISEERIDISVDMPRGSTIENLTLEPSLQSRTVRRSHWLADACSNPQQQRHSCLPQSKVPEYVTKVENETATTVGIGGDSENCTYVRMTVDDDQPVTVLEDWSTSNAEDSVTQDHRLPIPPPNSHSESGYQSQEGDKQSIFGLTDSRLLTCLSSSNELNKQPPVVSCHEGNCYNDMQQTSVTNTMSPPVKIHSNNPLQYPSSLSFITTYSCIANNSTHTSNSSSGQLVDVLHIHKDSIDSSKDDSIATCAPLMSSIENSNIQDHSPVSHDSYRSPLQSSSISSKLSKLLRSNPRKNELTSSKLSSDRRRWNVTCQYPSSTSLVSCQSVSLQWKRSHDQCKTSDGICSSMNLDAGFGVTVPHDENKSLPQPPPLTSSVANTCTSSYIFRPGYGCNVVHTTLDSAPTIMHSQVSTTTSALVTQPLSFGGDRPSFTPTVPSESATASCPTLCSMDVVTNSSIPACCSDTTSYTDPCQSPYLLVPDTGPIGTLDRERFDLHLDDLLTESTSSCMPLQESSMSTRIAKQKCIVEDEHSIMNTGFIDDIITHSGTKDMLSDISHCSNVASLSKSVASDSQKSIWKEVIDPATGRTLYMHSKSGNCVSSLPHESATDNEVHSFASMFSEDNLHDSLGHGIQDSLSSTGSPSSMGVPSGHSVCLDTELTRATHHPQPNRPRISLNIDSNSDTPTSVANNDLSISSLLADHKQQTQLPDTKWRDQSELNEISSIHGCEMAEDMSFNDILKRWKNPTFQGGEETVLRVGDGKRRQIKVHSIINRYKFSREMFSNIKVLGQVDNKFIACLMDSQSKGSPDLLVMIDQHAAHERVRLEALLDDLYATDTSMSSDTLHPPQIKSSIVYPPLAIKLQAGEVNLAKLFRQQFKHNGLSLKFDGSDEVLVTSLPSVFMEREASEVRRGRPTVAPTILKDMITKQIELLQATCGAATSTPETILNVLSSQACHGAIKFGDTLTVDECKALILSLSQCKLPFQCAHGRPSLVPILDLHILGQRYPTLEAAPFPILSKVGHNLRESK